MGYLRDGRLLLDLRTVDAADDEAVALAVERFLRSDRAAILGTMRDDRGMDELMESLGADVIGRAELHGVPVTLIAQRRGQRKPLDPVNEAIVLRLAASIGRGVL